jgi:hypothetical protein
MVVKDSNSLGFDDNHNTLFDANNNICCKKDVFKYESIRDLQAYKAELNQYYENQTNLQNENEYHYFVMGGVIKDSTGTLSQIKAGTYSVNYQPNNTTGITIESGLKLLQFNNITNTVSPNSPKGGLLNANFGGGQGLVPVTDPDRGNNSNNGNRDNSNKNESSNISRQTLAYSNATEDQPTDDSESDSDTPEEITISSASYAENADLGRNSPEAGATTVSLDQSKSDRAQPRRKKR